MAFLASDFKRELLLLVNKAKGGGTDEQEIVDILGDAADAVGEGNPNQPPRNVDVPDISGNPNVGSVLSCTMGNWDGSPTSYSYQWKRGTGTIGTDDSEYTIVAGDSGTTITCVVTATNGAGSTTAPPSNGVAIP